MADDVPEVAAEYGPPNPFEASPDQPGSYGPPSDVFTGSGSSSSTGSTGGGLDLSGLVKAAGDAVTTVVKTLGNLATPPTPQIPRPPSAPNLPASIPQVPASPAPQVTSPAAPPVRQPAAGGGNPQGGLTQVPTKLSTGAKVAIGLGVGGILVGGGLLIASAGGSRKR